MDAQPLSPNTSAFLSYLDSQLSDPSINLDELVKSATARPNNVAPQSMPPSALFPVPGRDTPEDTPSSHATSQSPENNRNVSVSDSENELSDRDRGNQRRLSGQGLHKRKAGQGHREPVEEDDEDASASDFATGHEDKKQHPNTKNTPGEGSGRRGGRKSTGGEDGKGGKEPSKAAKRKEQNRAAQKAFRERREAKVKDLEEKVAELEAKSYGTTVENENLRGILKRLQEENVALKQSAFTFSMPVSGNGTPAPQRQVAKPPTPPHSMSDDSLRSIAEPSPPILPIPQPRRTASSSNEESPESLVSVSETSSQPVNLFGADSFNAFALGGVKGSANIFSPNPPSTGGAINDNNKSNNSSASPEVDPFWQRIFLPKNVETSTSDATAIQQNQSGGFDKSVPYPNAFPLHPGQNWANNPSPNQRVAPAPNMGNTMAYRDPSASVPTAPEQPKQATDNWADLTGSSVDDFLASLAGGNNGGNADDLNLGTGMANGDDEYFNTQIQAILAQSGSGNSPSAAFNLPSSASTGPISSFSPTNYLNMSPSPFNVDSPATSASASGTGSKSNSHSPESSSTYPTSNASGAESGGDPMSGMGTFGQAKTDAEKVHLIDAQGKIVRPSDIWVQMGLQHENNVDNLVIDDLCDMMRAKATCKDGKKYLPVEDAAVMFSYAGHRENEAEHVKRLESWEKRAGMAPGSFPRYVG